jgi:hypothetical protein
VRKLSIASVSEPLPACLSHYLALAALNRLVGPCSKLAFADQWKTTAADRFTKIPAAALDHRRFWDAMHAVTLEQLEETSRRVALAIIAVSGRADLTRSPCKPGSSSQALAGAPRRLQRGVLVPPATSLVKRGKTTPAGEVPWSASLSVTAGSAGR